MYDLTKYMASGDSALNVEFGNSITEEVNKKIRAMTLAIEKNKIAGILEIVPTYRSLMIHYNSLLIDYDELVGFLKELEKNIVNIDLPAPEVIEIPTLYGGEYGPDIQNIAEYNNITVDEVIKIHTSNEYLIYMLGFTPGFAYLGGMSERIATPRLVSPRTKIPAGSVGIADKQTGIYPIASPGGWQLIGTTPLDLFNPVREMPILLKAGDYILFKSINEEEYMKVKSEVKSGRYEYKRYPKRIGDSNGTV